MRIHPALVALLSAAAVAACDVGTPPEIAALGQVPGGNIRQILVIVPPSVTMPVATTTQLAVNVPDSLLSSLSWISTQPSIAAVNQLGVVTALSPGSALIIARFNVDTTNRGVASITVTAAGAP